MSTFVDKCQISTIFDPSDSDYKYKEKKGGVHIMSNEEYKKQIQKMLNEISDNKVLKRIFDIVHFYFVRL